MINLAWLRRSVVAILVSLMIMVGLSALQPAAATPPLGHDLSCAQWDRVIDVKQVPIYKGTLCQYVWQQDAKGQNISTRPEDGWFNAVGYSFQSAGAVCNYWVDFDIYDKGQRYYHNQGATVSGCSKPVIHKTGSRELNADYILRPSSEICTTLFRWNKDQAERIVTTCAVV